MSDYITDLRRFLERGVSPYHAVREAAETLAAQGFTPLALGGDFPVERGGRYFVEYGTFLAAFTVGDTADFFRIAAAHTDCPVCA